METPKVLWAGEVAGEHWELQPRDIYEGPLAWPDPEERDEVAIEGSRVVVWNLVFVSSTGAQIEVWWDPAARTLGGTQLRGWNTHVIGDVKRRLIALGTIVRPTELGGATASTVTKHHRR